MGIAVLAVVVAVAWYAGREAADVPKSPPITGEFAYWVPLDEARGYAYFTLKNHGDTTRTAHCQIEVRSDIGDRGLDILVGVTLEPGESWTGRIALTVSNDGALVISKGSVTNC